MRIVLSDYQPQRIETLRRVLLGEGLSCDASDAVDFDGLPARLSAAAVDLVAIACDGPLGPALAAVRSAYHVTGAPILAIGLSDDLERVRAVLAAGAREYLDLSRVREELSEAVLKIQADEQSPGRRGQIVSLFSPSGGVGVSTTAVNLAARLAKQLPGQVALVDLKPAPSDLALLLDIEPQHTLEHVCRHWERLDRQMLAGAMVPHSSGVQVLAQVGYPANGGLVECSLSREAVRQVLTLLRRMFAVTVLDLDHTLSVPQIEAMRLSNFIGLLARPDVPGLRRARWALDTVAGRGLPRERFRLVLNRYGQGGQLGVAQAEEILGIKVFQSIPEDGRSMNRAVNRGVPVSDISRLSRLTRSFSSFARNVQAN
ncbi:MAG: hypothetical protein K2Y37_20795 [Pirellulales bacterium]|nr:hypothetical protein [Pirellulales bacterium]